jgi:hypothetical protein
MDNMKQPPDDLTKEMYAAQQGVARRIQGKPILEYQAPQNYRLCKMALFSAIMSLLIVPVLLFCMGFFGWFNPATAIVFTAWVVVSVLLGSISWVRIKRSRGTLRGLGLAGIGTLLGWLQFLYFLPGIIEDIRRHF